MVKTFQLMVGNFQPRAVAAPWPLDELCGCATTSLGDCWPSVVAEVCCGLLLGVLGGIKQASWGAAGFVEGHDGGVGIDQATLLAHPAFVPLALRSFS